MTNTPTPASITQQANLIGDPYKVRCKYEWDSPKRRFVWNFYRNGRYIGKTAQQNKVVSMMNKFIA